MIASASNRHLLPLRRGGKWDGFHLQQSRIPRSDVPVLGAAEKREMQLALLHADQIAALKFIWSIEKCFICGDTGICPHREFEVGLARIEGLELRAKQIRRLA